MSDELVKIRFLARTIYYALNGLAPDENGSVINNLASKTEDLTAALCALSGREFNPVERAEPICAVNEGDAVDDAPAIFTKIHAKAVMSEVLSKYELTEEELLGKSRFPEIVRPRHELMWRLSRELKWSYSRIGRMLQRDHTSVVAGIKGHQKNIDEVTR